MSSTLPTDIHEFMSWPWSRIEPYYHLLEDTPLAVSNVEAWLSDWSRLGDLLIESHARLRVAVDQDTADPQAEGRYNAFLDSVYPASQAANQRLKEKLLASDLEPAGFAVPLRKIRAEAAIFRTENLALLVEEHKLVSQFNKIIGAQTVSWEGRELTLQQLRQVYLIDHRPTRQRAWELAASRQLADREALNHLWAELMGLRRELASNAGLPDYQAFRWQQLLRLDYTPADSLEFQRAVEQVVVPAATRIYQKHSRRLGLDRLRPWDLDQDLYPLDFPPLPPYGSIADLQARSEHIFGQLDPELGEYFREMRAGGYLDLENRKSKAPGGYCTAFPMAKRSFIFMNAVGLASDVRTLLHESGHAFHNFERFHLPYMQQRMVGLEFAEVASMTMELLTHPYLSLEQGGFYPDAAARRFRIAHLERILLFWPYMAVVDAFQSWVYSHHTQASDPASCDDQWLELWHRFLPGVDWDGLEAEACTGWHRKQHIFRAPLYYVEYGLAQLGAVQIWQNASPDPAGALHDYRRALSLGGTASLPELYLAAGARFAFDAATLADAVDRIERSLAELEEI